MSLEIRMVGTTDLDLFIDHLELVQAQSGQRGDPVFTPFAVDEPADYGKMRERRLAGWGVPVGRPGWRRAWAAFSENAIVGDVELEGGGIPADQHRATLGMGIQRAYRGQGLGSRLLDTAITWAREHGLSYIDLGVFAGNEPAERLYRKFGFEPWGVHRDAFRVGEHSVDDIQMVRRL